jgi:hypothetical protein
MGTGSIIFDPWSVMHLSVGHVIEICLDHILDTYDSNEYEDMGMH